MKIIIKFTHKKTFFLPSKVETTFTKKLYKGILSHFTRRVYTYGSLWFVKEFKPFVTLIMQNGTSGRGLRFRPIPPTNHNKTFHEFSTLLSERHPSV